MSDIYIVVHIATTCDDNIAKDTTEIIEFSWSVVEATNLDIVSTNTIHIKPFNTPVTPYCTRVTKVAWDDVKDAGTFKDAINQFDTFVQEKVINKNKDFSFASLDSSKLRVQLPREARDKGVVLPPYLQHPRVFDLQNEYCKWQISHPETLSYTSNSLTNIVTALEVDVDKSDIPSPTSDTPNSNSPTLTNSKPVDQIITIFSKLLVQLIKKSFPIEEHLTVLTRPYDASHDVKLFLTERSKILYLSNLPFDTTQSELESWFTQYGARPIAFWTLKNLETSGLNNNVLKNKVKGISGFAVFGTHEEATEALSMNGRALNDRAIEVQPSSTRVLDKASELLTPFPSSKNRPRPGDWTCPSCGFSNFQRRTACFRCSFPASSQALSFQDQVIGNRRGNSPTNGSDKLTLNVYNNGYSSQYYNDGHGLNHGHHNHHANNRNYNGNGGNSVPFRAGDWKCTNESCQYHNFAKNLICLKCGMNKPSNLHNVNQMNKMHNVSSTAAAIAAATASGQSLNLTNNYLGQNQGQNQGQIKPQQQSMGYKNMYQPNGLTRTVSNGASTLVHNSHLLTQQYLMMQPLDSGASSASSAGIPSGASHSLSSPASLNRTNYSQSATNSPGLYQGFGYSQYQTNSQLDSSLGFNSISNQFSTLNLNNS